METRDKTSGLLNMDRMQCIEMAGYIMMDKMKAVDDARGIRNAVRGANSHFEAKKIHPENYYLTNDELAYYLEMFGISREVWDVQYAVWDARYKRANKRLQGITNVEGRIKLPILRRICKADFRNMVENYNEYRTEIGYKPIDYNAFSMIELKIASAGTLNRSINEAIIKELFRHVTAAMFLSHTRRYGQTYDSWFRSLIGMSVMAEGLFNLESVVYMNTLLGDENRPKEDLDVLVSSSKLSPEALGLEYYEFLIRGFAELRIWLKSCLESYEED